MTDISKEAVNALAGQCENHISEMTGLSGMSSLEADTLRALRTALDEAEAEREAVLDRESAAYARHDAALAKAEAERAAANALLRRAKTELELIRSKDCGAVYDILVRIEIDAHLGAKP